MEHKAINATINNDGAALAVGLYWTGVAADLYRILARLERQRGMDGVAGHLEDQAVDAQAARDAIFKHVASRMIK